MNISAKTIWILTLLTALLAFVATSLEHGPSARAQDDSSTSTPAGPVDTSAATEGSGGDATGDAENHPESYLDFAVAGGPLMIPLGVASLLWLTFLVERLVALRRSGILPPGLSRAVHAIPAGQVDLGQVESICAENESRASRVLRVAATHIDQTRPEIEDAVNNAAQREIHSMRRYLRLFAVIAAVAPLLGLLGTVTGMIQAFREVAMSGLGAGKALAPGIYKALVTTATGLIVAIPALLTHSWLQSRIDNYVHAINTLVVDFVEKHRPVVKAPGVVPSRDEEPASSLGAGSA